MHTPEPADAQRALARCLLTLQDAAENVRDMVAGLPPDQQRSPAVREFDRLQKCARLAVLSGREALGTEAMEAAARAREADLSEAQTLCQTR